MELKKSKEEFDQLRKEYHVFKTESVQQTNSLQTDYSILQQKFNQSIR
jgi:uncharacterized membrane-anchored protein YhcB (DUF1043 family)